MKLNNLAASPWWPYVRLMRLDRPIGVFLLLWPTLWALWLAGSGRPSVANIVIFSLGVLLMRSAGCVVNDYADRNLDGHVRRTKARPLATGEISVRQALVLFVSLCFLALILVLLTNLKTVMLSVVAVLLAAVYPFMKRHTYLPQVVLGAAFGWAIPMAWAAEEMPFNDITWLLFTANLLWTVVYDTMYAMTDREDDLKIGIKSTAILFGDYDRAVIGLLQLLTLLALTLVGIQAGTGIIYYISIVIAGVLMLWQQWHIRERDPQACFQAFLHNNWVGVVIFAGLFLDLSWF